MSLRKLFLLVLLSLGASSLPAQVNVLSYHNDLASTGQNLNENQLIPSEVNAATFGKIFSAAVDGQVYGQPLYVAGLPMTVGAFQDTTHDVVFVTTQNDSVYAFDAVSGTQLWYLSLINGSAGETAVPNGDLNTNDITPQVGIVSTPLIDPTPNPTTQLRYIYVVAKSRVVVNGLNYYYIRLHAIDIASGKERAGSPVLIAETAHLPNNSAPYNYAYSSGPSVAGTGDGSINGVVNFNAMRANQRPGLTLVNGILYIAFASHGDNGPYHGWLLGYNTSAMQLTAVFNSTPNGSEGGIWMAGGIPVSDASGALYFMTGNGSFANKDPDVDAATTDFDSNSFPLNHDYGDSVIKLVVDSSTASKPNPNGWGLKVVDYFTPFDQESLNQGDTDLGSGGPVLLPDSVGNSAHPHLMVCSGKEGRIYLLDQENLGKFRGGIVNSNSGATFASTGDNIVNASGPGTIQGSFDTPAYFNRHFYYVGAHNNDIATCFGVGNGTFTTSPVSQSADNFGYLGSSPSISASSATSNGIVWCMDRGTNELRAYDATNLANELYNSNQAGGNRDELGTAVKFGTVTIANGHVLCGTGEPAGPSALVAYGLFAPPTTPPAAPTNLYGATVSGGQIDLFWSDNANNEAGYQIFISLDPNNFPTTPNATTAANVTTYAAAGLQANTTYYFRVRAYNSIGNSAYSDTAGTTSGGAPPVDFTNGFANSSQYLTFNGFTGPALAGSELQLTDGNQAEGRSVWFNTAQSIAQFTTQFTFLLTQANADGFTFTVQNQGLSALGSDGGDLGYKGILNSAAIKFDLYPALSTTGLYLNGVAPDDNTSPNPPDSPSGAIDTSAEVNFHNGDTMEAVLTYNGTMLTETITDLATRAVFNQTYTVNLVSMIGSSTAYVGFTGGTGGETAVQDILSWSYTASLPSAPAAPSNLTVTATSASQFDLAWKDNSNDETSFRIERAQGSGNFVAVGSVGANTTTYVDSNLITNTTYSYRVYATNAGVDSTASNVVTSTTPTAPTTPSGAMATLVTANEIDFQWVDNSNNEAGFNILRQAGSGNFIEIATLPPNTTSYKDTSVSPGTEYNYHIEAYNAAGYIDFTGFEVTTPATVNVVTATANAQEGTTASGGLTISRVATALDSALTVNYTIKTGAGQAPYGARYTLTPTPTTTTTGSVVIPANATSTTLLVNPGTSETLTGPQSVTIILAAGSGYTITGSTTAVVTLLDTPLNTWKIQEFGSLTAAESPQAADNAEYDGDGVPNLLAYALGANPTKTSTSQLPTAKVESVDGGRYLTLTFNTPSPAPTDVTYIVEACTELATPNWQAAATVSGYPLNNGDGTETWKVRTTWADSAYPESFIHLRVTRP